MRTNGHGSKPANRTISQLKSNHFFTGPWWKRFFSFLLCICFLLSTFIIFPTPAQAASISLSQTSGPVGTSITITGGGFTASTAGYVWFDSDGDGVRDGAFATPPEPQKSLTTTPAGNIPAAIALSAPKVPAGTYQVRADIPTGGTIEAYTGFTIIPQISLLNPDSGPPGTSVTVSGNGFAASAAGWLWFDSNDDAVRDAEEPQTSLTTNSVGEIPASTGVSVDDVNAGTYKIRADIPAGDSVEAYKNFTATAGVALDPPDGIMDTEYEITVTGGSFAVSTPGWVWFDLDNDNVRDAGEPQVSVTSTASGALPSGVTLETPALPPNTTCKVQADIPSGGSIETYRKFVISKATTKLIITKYDAYGNVADTVNATYEWLEDNCTVYGDGTTHYYHQGPTFDAGNLWDPGESVNVESRDYGAPWGTDVKDLCGLVGGASAGDTVEIKASDDFSKTFDYEDIYYPEVAQGRMIIAWRNSSFGGYVPDYDTGMRLIFFADNSTNPWGYHVFGHWNMHETLPESRWYFYEGTWPSSSGLSVQNVYYINIYQPNLFACDSSGDALQEFSANSTVYLKGRGLEPNTDYDIWIQEEPVVFSDALSSGGDPSGAQESFTTDGNGDFGPSAIWNIDPEESAGNYDIIADNQAAGTSGVFDINDGICNVGWQGFSVTPGEFVSFTITDYNNDGLRFGYLVQGDTDRPADWAGSLGAVTITVGAETNVDVDVQVKGEDFTGDGGSIPINNLKFNDDDTLTGATALSGTYATWFEVETPLSGDYVTQVYYWLSIPSELGDGDYNSTLYYRAVKSS